MKKPRCAPNGANTLAEVLIALLLVGLFFGSIFELNAVCLRYIEASKESVTAITAVQDRTEVLRNLAFADLTSSSYLQSLPNLKRHQAVYAIECHGHHDAILSSTQFGQ
jgi:hypothetical protein